MENDLISRSALLDALETEEWAGILGNSFVRYMKAKALIEKIPAVDAVEVVRCKDCKWFNSVGCAIYIVDESDKPKESDFCSYGERRGT